MKQAKKTLNLVAPIAQTGYGVAGFNILKTLMERNWDVSLFPYGDWKQCGRYPEELEIIEETIERSVFFDYDAPCLNIWHQHDLKKRIGTGPYIGFPIFELDRFTDVERHNLAYPDHLFVTSEWAKSIIENNSVLEQTDSSTKMMDPDISVIPLGIDPEIFNPNIVKQKEAGPTIFLNCGKWEIRKGHDILVEIFNEAFGPDDDVELWMMPHNPFLSKRDQDNWINHYISSPLGNKIKILPWRRGQYEVAHAMSLVDCGIFPSRAEGWNMELLEMMALGKPVITTNYSAHTEFCDEYNSLLSEIGETELAYDGKWFFEQGSWAKLDKPQKDSFIADMRFVHRKVQSPGNYINDAGIETGKKYTWDNTIDKIEEFFECL